MTLNTSKKLADLKALLASMQSAVLAFSGGVDSTFLLKVATDILKDRVIAVTARSDMFISLEYNEAKEIAESLNVNWITVESEALKLPDVWKNPPDRCYHCKRAIFLKMLEIARSRGIDHVLDGTHAGDTDDYRPGIKALAELGIRSPLKEAGLTKAEIRSLSADMGLPTADKPSMACLASRFPYGIHITRDKLKQVASAETALYHLGFRQLRVRHHGNLARIEIASEALPRLAEPETRQKIVETLKELGYQYVTLDLEGYRTGSLNEVLK